MCVAVATFEVVALAARKRKMRELHRIALVHSFVSRRLFRGKSKGDGDGVPLLQADADDADDVAIGADGAAAAAAVGRAANDVAIAVDGESNHDDEFMRQ